MGFALDLSMRVGDESMTSMGEPMWRRSRRVGNWLSSSSGPQQPMPLCEAGSCVPELRATIEIRPARRCVNRFVPLCRRFMRCRPCPIADLYCIEKRILESDAAFTGAVAHDCYETC